MTSPRKRRMPSLSLKRHGDISLGKQLVTQLSQRIAEGFWQPGEKLPSVRDLAARLGIHYNTVHQAYKELGALGMVESVHGSGVRVRRFSSLEISPTEADPTTVLLHPWLRDMIRRGHDLESILDRVKAVYRRQARWMATGPARIFVDPHGDILPLFAAEFLAAFHQGRDIPDAKGPVAVEVLDEGLIPRVAKGSPVAQGVNQGQQVTFLVSRYHLQQLEGELQRHGEMMGEYGLEVTVQVVEVGDTAPLVARLQGLPEGGFVSLITLSSTLMEIAETMVAATRGEALLVKGVLGPPGGVDGEELARALKHADVVFADGVWVEYLKHEYGGGKPGFGQKVMGIPMLPQDWAAGV